MAKMICVEPNCNTPIKWSFVLKEWGHEFVDAYSETHKAKAPDGTQRPLNLIEELMSDTAGKYQAARAKYEPLVSKLTDMEFAGLYNVVMEERTRRITHLMLTNPAVRQHAIEMLRKNVS